MKLALIVCSAISGGLLLLAACAPMQAMTTSTSENHAQTIKSLVNAVRDDPTKKPLLVKALMQQQVFMIPDPHAKSVQSLKIDQNERSFIPVFSDALTFDEEAYGTGFEKKAIAVDARFFASLLKGDEIVILNPGHKPAIQFQTASRA